MNQRVVTIIVNFNKPSDTIDCVSSLWKSLLRPEYVIVVDNGSDPESYDELRTGLSDYLSVSVRYPESSTFSSFADSGTVYLLRSHTNLGYAGGNNLALKWALEHLHFDCVWMLNNDCLVDQNALAALLDKAGSPETGAVGSKLLFFKEPKRLQAAGGGVIFPLMGRAKLIGFGEIDEGQWDRELKLDFIMGASLMVTRATVERVGLMSEDYFLYWEESDWCLRMKRAQMRLRYAWESRVYHKVDPLTPPSTVSDFYISRNTPIFLFRHFPRFFLAGTFISCVSRIAKRAARGLWKNAVFTMKGYREGIKMLRAVNR